MATNLNNSIHSHNLEFSPESFEYLVNQMQAMLIKLDTANQKYNDVLEENINLKRKVVDALKERNEARRQAIDCSFSKLMDLASPLRVAR